MMFTNEERRLLALYYSGPVTDTANTLRLALRDITDSDEREAVHSILRKIEDADNITVAGLSESVVAYG